jgi:DNA processing protein
VSLGPQNPASGTSVTWNERTEREEVRALLRLKGISRLGDKGIWGLVRGHGSGVAALRAAGSQKGLWDEKDQGFPIGEWLDSGLTLLPITSPHYPQPLLALPDPPPLLFLKGREELLHKAGVAVVGARKATESGRRSAHELGRVLGRAGVNTISGMALGIDGAAHRGALEAGGDTVAVLGSGLQVVYPRAHRTLFRDIANQGLVVSEFLPTEPALPHHFPKRNRILAALAEAVVVVEAGERSGALITVDHGLDLGRDILAFPGSVESKQAAGTNALIRDGARILTHPGAILDELPELVARGGEVGGDELAVNSGLPAGLHQDLSPLWSSLSAEPMGLDPLAEAAGMAPQDALAGLSTLELMGWAHRCPGMRFRRG